MSDVFREGSPLDRARGQESITDFDRKVFQSMQKVLWIPDEFKEYMTQYGALNQPPIPIGQIFGFAGFTFQIAMVDTNEATSSTTVTDLATDGPTLSGLAPGSYAFFWTSQPNTFLVATNFAQTHLYVNGGQVAGAITIMTGNTTDATNNTCTGIAIADLTEPSNEAKLRYSNNAANSISYANRRLLAVKYANL